MLPFLQSQILKLFYSFLDVYGKKCITTHDLEVKSYFDFLKIASLKELVN